jgi:hypothetical protein
LVGLDGYGALVGAAHLARLGQYLTDVGLEK